MVVKIGTPEHSLIHLWIFGTLGILLLATGPALLISLNNPIAWLIASLIGISAAMGLSLYFQKKGESRGSE